MDRLRNFALTRAGKIVYAPKFPSASTPVQTPLVCACGCAQPMTLRESGPSRKGFAYSSPPGCVSPPTTYQAALCARVLENFPALVHSQSFRCTDCPAKEPAWSTVEFTLCERVELAAQPELDGSYLATVHNTGNWSFNVTLLPSNSTKYQKVTDVLAPWQLWLPVDKVIQEIPSLMDGLHRTVASRFMKLQPCVLCAQRRERERVEAAVKSWGLAHDAHSPAHKIAELFPGHDQAVDYFRTCKGGAGVIRALRFLPPSTSAYGPVKDRKRKRGDDDEL